MILGCILRGDSRKSIISSFPSCIKRVVSMPVFEYPMTPVTEKGDTTEQPKQAIAKSKKARSEGLFILKVQ